MANSSLQGYTWDVPEELHGHLKRIMNAYKGDKNAEGYPRLKSLIENPKISYEQLKRIKNFFDSHSTTDYMNGKDDRKQDTQFILNGGTKMRYWVNDTLTKARDNIKKPKEVKKNTGMANQFQKDDIRHTKDGINTKSLKVSNDNLKIKESYSDIYIKKEVRLMESLINIFDKNKQSCHTDK